MCQTVGNDTRPGACDGDGPRTRIRSGDAHAGVQRDRKVVEAMPAPFPLVGEVAPAGAPERQADTTIGQRVDLVEQVELGSPDRRRRADDERADVSPERFHDRTKSVRSRRSGRDGLHLVEHPRVGDIES